MILHTLHPALEDGTDRGFRNVGKPQSEAGEIPRRIHTRLDGNTEHCTMQCHSDLDIGLARMEGAVEVNSILHQ